MLWLAMAAALSQAPIPPGPLDVSRLTTGESTLVAEVDLGKLKGNELRQLGWAPDGSRLYFQTVDGDKPNDLVHHYSIAVEGGGPVPEPSQPDWAAEFWAFKSDRFAPGIPSIAIDLNTKTETVKVGTGTAGAADRTGNPLGGENVMSTANIEREAQNSRERVFQLVLYEEAISEFVNTRPIPGLMFGWGPSGSGAIAYTDRAGRLRLLDRQKHAHTVSGARDAVLPAWTKDGARLAYFQKTGRRKYQLRYIIVTP